MKASPRGASRLLELVAVLAIIGVLAALLLPALSGAKSKARSTSVKNTVINNLRLFDGAKQTWALEGNKTADAVPTFDDIKPYLGRGGDSPEFKETDFRSPAGETYVLGKVSEQPKIELSASQAKKFFGREAVAAAETRDGKVGVLLDKRS